MTRLRHFTSCRRTLFALVVPMAASHAQPGVPPNDPDSWRLAGTAKILCSSLFVSGRDDAEARAHVTPYFIGPKLDSITNLEIDRQRFTDIVERFRNHEIWHRHNGVWKIDGFLIPDWTWS